MTFHVLLVFMFLISIHMYTMCNKEKRKERGERRKRRERRLL